jgi:hypothetical protein
MLASRPSRLYFGDNLPPLLWGDPAMRIVFSIVLVILLVDIAWAVKPLPEKSKLDAAKVAARDRYFNALKKADTAELTTYLEAADATTDDDARQAALYLVVADAAVESGHIKLALIALDRLGKNFDYDAPSGKLKLLEAAGKSTKTAEARIALVNRLLELIEESIDGGRFEIAEQAAKLGESLAARLRDAKLRKELAARRARLEARRRENRAEADALAKAEEMLKHDANDPEANRLVGLRFAAEDQWSKALAHLVQADDDDLRAAAKAESGRPDSSVQQLALADAWWQVADGVENEKQRAAVRARAVYWYSRAVAGLEGLRRTRADRRIKYSGEETVQAAASQTSGDENLADVVLGKGVVLRLAKIPANEDGTIKGFWLGQTELTEGQWAAIMGDAAASRDLPKVLISFNQCRTMLAKLNAAPIGRRFHFRLPTPEEFAHACGKPSSFVGKLSDYGWFKETSPEKVQRVGQKKANVFGLFDILGNVWEFAADGRFYGMSAWDSESPIQVAYTSTELPPNYNGVRADYTGDNLGVRIAADLR